MVVTRECQRRAKLCALADSSPLKIAELRSAPATAAVIEGPRSAPASVPPWEHLSLLARWYYSSFREGELVMLNAQQTIPHTRLIRICRKILAV